MTGGQRQSWPAGRAVLSVVIASVALRLALGWLSMTFPSDLEWIAAGLALEGAVAVLAWYVIKWVSAGLRRRRPSP